MTMKKLGKIKLDQLNKAELSEKELNRLWEEKTVVCVLALDRLDRLTTLMQMLQVVCTLHRGLAVLMDHIACRNSSK